MERSSTHHPSPVLSLEYPISPREPFDPAEHIMSQKLANEADSKSEKYLPGPREGKALSKDAPLPLANTSLSTVIFSVCAAALLYLAYYAYLTTQWCVCLTFSIIYLLYHTHSYLRKDEAGGWVNFALGRTPSPEPTDGAVPFSPETQYEQKPEPAGEVLVNRIQELADQLGIEPTEFVSAIKTLVHPTKASALEKDTKAMGSLVGVLAEAREKAQEETEKPLSWMNALVGLDEPPHELPA